MRFLHQVDAHDSAVPRTTGSHPSNAGGFSSGVELSRFDEVAMKIRFVRLVGLEHVQPQGADFIKL